jgi:hypothetical protein
MVVSSMNNTLMTGSYVGIDKKMLNQLLFFFTHYKFIEYRYNLPCTYETTATALHRRSSK